MAYVPHVPRARIFPRPVMQWQDWYGGQVWAIDGDDVTVRTAISPSTAHFEDIVVSAAALGHTVIVGDAILLQLTADRTTLLDALPGQFGDPPRDQAAEAALPEGTRPWRPANIPADWTAPVTYTD